MSFWTATDETSVGLRRAYFRKYAEAHRAELRAYRREYRARDLNHARARSLAWARANPEKVKANWAAWRARNPDSGERNSDHRRNPARRTRMTAEARQLHREYQRSYRQRHPGKVREYNRQYKRRVMVAIVERLRIRLWTALKLVGARKVDATMAIAGCSREQLRAHFEAKFQPGMSWENYGAHGWHIDHVRPCATFDLTDPEQQRACFHYSNLQPLWARDNLAKGASWGG